MKNFGRKFAFLGAIALLPTIYLASSNFFKETYSKEEIASSLSGFPGKRVVNDPEPKDFPVGCRRGIAKFQIKCTSRPTPMIIAPRMTGIS